MSWSSGTYTKWNGAGGWTADSTAGIGIEAGRHDTQDTDFQNGINNCIAKDGQNTPTANLPMSGHKHTGVGNGVLATDYMAYGQIRNGTPLYMDTTNNRLGINTSSPSNALTVFSQASDTDGTGTDQGQSIFRDTRNATSGLVIGYRYQPSVTEYARIQTISGTNLVLQGGGGRIGIGTNNVSGLLHAYQVTSTIPHVFVQGLTTASGGSGKSNVNLDVNGNGGWLIENDASGGLRTLVISDNNGYGASTTERMRITSGGLVGVNNNAPVARLDVQGPGNAGAVGRYASTSAGLGTACVNISKFDNSNATSNILVAFQINNGATGSGNIVASGALNCAFAATSDERLKENIVELPSQWDAFKALRPVEFDYKGGLGHQIGFIAQEVEEVYPDLVGAGNDGYLMLTDMAKNDARTIKVIKELMDRVEALEAQLAAE